MFLCNAAVSGAPGSSPVLEVTDTLSVGSMLNSNLQSEDGQYEIDKRLYLIKYDNNSVCILACLNLCCCLCNRYGKLSNTIHKYFRRLE